MVCEFKNIKKSLIWLSNNQKFTKLGKEHANCVQVMHYHDTDTSIMGWVGYARQPEVVGVAYCCPNSQISVADTSQQAIKEAKSITTRAPGNRTHKKVQPIIRLNRCGANVDWVTALSSAC